MHKCLHMVRRKCCRCICQKYFVGFLTAGFLICMCVFKMYDDTGWDENLGRTKNLFGFIGSSGENNTFRVQGHAQQTLHYIRSSGEHLATRIRDKCKNNLYPRSYRKNHILFPITTNSKHKLMFCPMCKLASTYWTQFFVFLKKSRNNSIKSPYDIPIKEAPPSHERMLLKQGSTNVVYNNYYKFVFVRDPYTRLLSAFVDKFFAPNPIFWKSAQQILGHLRHRPPNSKCGSDITFAEYVKAVIRSHHVPTGAFDCHDQTYLAACHPCEVRYDFVGKMEHFTNDSLFIYQRLQLNDSIRFLLNNGKQLADKDALSDTVTSPFLWKRQIEACIPWREALHRMWRKLQIRGVIGKHPFPLNDEQAAVISQTEFIELIQNTQRLTPYSLRKEQRREALQEIYGTIDPADIQALKRVFSIDFDLFEYDSDPSWLPSNSVQKPRYGFLSV